MQKKTLLTLLTSAMLLAFSAASSQATTCFGKTAHWVGGPGNDYKVGDSSGEVFRGSKGDDTIYGQGGDDTICGNEGTDYLYGKRGNDYLKGGDRTDYLYGGEGHDYIDGTYGDWDVIDGGDGTDTCHHWDSGTC